MNARMGSGWQTVLADLAMILFMITAAAVSESAPDTARPVSPSHQARPPVLPTAVAARSAGPATAPALGEPVAVWRATPGGPTLHRWLGAQGADPRARLTVIAAPRDAHAALGLADGASGGVRLLLDPAVRDAPYAVLAYDADPGIDPHLARSLLPPAQTPPAALAGARGALR